jgi:outer membrane protein assembly factor BamB
MDGEIDGIAIGKAGPVLIHSYDPPAGGKWIDDVIPGRLGAYERHTGEPLWVSPCEVGYGRGFAAGIGQEDDCFVLGPGSGGHLIARMSLSSGELLGAGSIEAFDQALFGSDVSLTLTPARVSGVLTAPMLEVWTYQREGARFHLMGRDGDDGIVMFTDKRTQRQGVFRLDLELGELAGELLPPELANVHDMAVGDGVMVLLAGDGARAERLFLLGASTRDGRVLWRESVQEEALGGMPDVTISLDAGKLYVGRDASLDVRDALTGRLLGEMTVPGLDEHLAWKVSQGAGLLAEETRVSVFEIPD